MRHRLSRAVLWLQPVFLAAPLALLVWPALARGWVTAAIVLVLMSALDVVVAWRGRARRLSQTDSADKQPDAGGARADADGPVVTRADGHPRLWALVDEAAGAAGVDPPERIVVQMSTMAAVAPLDPGRGPAAGGYELVLSSSLLAEGSVPQLEAILAHELGHVAAPDWGDAIATANVIERWTMPFYDALPLGLLKLGGWFHLRLWLLVEAWANRPAERRADDVAFRLAGPRTTAEALTFTDRLDVALQLLLAAYLPLAARGNRRAVVIDGVRALLAEGHRIDGLLASAEPGGARWEGDAHPPVTARIAAAERAAAAGRGAAADERAAQRAQLRAVDLLDGGRQWLADGEVEMLLDDHALRRAPVADWGIAVDLGWRAMLADDVHLILDAATVAADAKGRRTVPSAAAPAPVPGPSSAVTARMFLAAVDRLGIGQVVHDPDLSEEEGYQVLIAIAARALDRAGRLRMTLSWAEEGRPEYFDGNRWWALGADLTDDTPLPSAPGAPGAELGPVSLAVRDVATGRASIGRLFDALGSAGADLDAPLDLSADERAERAGEFLSGHARASVRRGGESLGHEWFVIVGTTGIWLVEQQPAEEGWALPSEREQRQRDAIEELARVYDTMGRPDQVRWPQSIWIPEEGLTQVRAARIFQPRVELIAPGGQTLEFVLRGAGVQVGYDLYTALDAMAGKRLIAS